MDKWRGREKEREIISFNSVSSDGSQIEELMICVGCFSQFLQMDFYFEVRSSKCLSLVAMDRKEK